MTVERTSPLHTFLIFLRPGLTSFGGPVAHLGYFREAFVQRRQWLSDAQYADPVALCSVLPGPASSQVGMALGLNRGGYAGLLAAWLGFTLPAFLLLVGVLPFWERLRPPWRRGPAARDYISPGKHGAIRSVELDTKRIGYPGTGTNRTFRGNVKLPWAWKRLYGYSRCERDVTWLQSGVVRQ